MIINHFRIDLICLSFFNHTVNDKNSTLVLTSNSTSSAMKELRLRIRQDAEKTKAVST